MPPFSKVYLCTFLEVPILWSLEGVQKWTFSLLLSLGKVYLCTFAICALFHMNTKEKKTMPIQYKSCKCGAKISRSLKRCPDCEKALQKDYNDNRRDKGAAAFYNSKEWRAVRKLVLERNPFCSMCDRPADVVDHIVEIKDGGPKLDPSNLRPMCHYHHNKRKKVIITDGS